MNVFPLDPEGHARVQALLPWFVTGRLDDGDRAQVEKHLAGCARCRAELALERQLRAAQALPDDSDAAAERGLARLRRRIEQPAAHRPAPWWRWALGLQFVVIAALAAVLLVPRPDAAPFRGLGTEPASAPNAVVMFDPGATEAQIRQALHAADARLVGGPTKTSAYLLVLPLADAAALARLRSQPGVTMAESLAAESGS